MRHKNIDANLHKEKVMSIFEDKIKIINKYGEDAVFLVGQKGFVEVVGLLECLRD